MMKMFLVAAIAFLFLLSAFSSKTDRSNDRLLALGQMPNLASDRFKNLHLVYGNGDSIFYSHSAGNGSNFAKPVLVAVLPHLAASHTRGPQIAVGDNGLLITACTNEGNIFSYKNENGTWSQTARVNDVDTTAKENLMALSADGKNAFAVWLDLRGNKRNKIVGARSTDGGKTWLKNKIIYASPDSSVCECCKPSVVVKGNEVLVMFRNWLDGNRDLYLIKSNDGGNSFGAAQKLGTGNWPLKGCPMDGGGMAVSEKGSVVTVWNRMGAIYSCAPQQQENEIGKGRSCTVERIGDGAAYAWVENGEVVVVTPNSKKINLGKGQLPVIKAGNKNLVCAWENNKQIHTAAIAL